MHIYQYIHFICIGTAFSKAVLSVPLTHLNPWLGWTSKHEGPLFHEEKCLSFRKLLIAVLSSALEKSVHFMDCAHI